MISFDKGNMAFNYRVSAIILHNNKILLHKTADTDFWSLPGGRCEFLETSIDALKREVKEEMRLDCKVKRLVWVVENFLKICSAYC